MSRASSSDLTLRSARRSTSESYRRTSSSNAAALPRCASPMSRASSGGFTFRGSPLAPCIIIGRAPRADVSRISERTGGDDPTRRGRLGPHRDSGSGGGPVDQRGVDLVVPRAEDDEAHFAWTAVLRHEIDYGVAGDAGRALGGKSVDPGPDAGEGDGPGAGGDGLGEACHIGAAERRVLAVTAPP